MTIQYYILIVSLCLSLLGLIYELSSRVRARHIRPDSGKRPEFSHRNLRLLGPFNYRTGRIYYQCFCFGHLPLAPIGCYLSGSPSAKDIISGQKVVFWEILALYLRWGWVVALFSTLLIVL